MTDYPNAAPGNAPTPEELEVLLEDTVLLRDTHALAALFEEGAVLVAGAHQPAHGGQAIARLALASWQGDHSYLSDARTVVQARDTALVVTGRGVNVLRRGGDGVWRYVIVFQAVIEGDEMEIEMEQNKVQAKALEPVAVGRDEGQAWWWLGSLAVIKATAANTGGQMSIIEITDPPGGVGPLHVHHREDEAFYILEGEATFEVGGTVIEAHAGDYVYGPRGIPHRYSVGAAGCRMLFIFTPGGFENLIMEMSVPAASRTLPPPSTEEPDWAKIEAIAESYGNELLE